MRNIPVDTSALGAFVLVQAVPATYGDGVRKVSTSGEPISELRVLVTPPQGNGQRMPVPEIVKISVSGG